MILHPHVLALLGGSVCVALVLVYATRSAVQILRRWDLASGSELQLGLERKTYLVTTALVWAFCFQLVSLVLFIYIADDLAQVFVGAMCAAGTLNLNAFGYPTILLKVLNFLLAGTWLILNAVDNRAPDYPLIRTKYRLLLLITPAILLETALQAGYFLGLEPHVITSCCGSLFSQSAQGLQASLFTFPHDAVRAVLLVSMGLTTVTGVLFLLHDRKLTGYLYSVSGLGTFVVSVAAFISYLCLFFYELPTHNCPFCVFQREYGNVGYPLYLFLLGGAVLVLGVGALTPFRGIASLHLSLPRTQKALCLTSLLLYGAFGAMVALRAATSNLSF